MRLKDLSIGMKLGGMIAVVLSLLVLVGWLSLRAMAEEAREAVKLEHLMALDATLLHREIDHLQWAGKVTGFLLDGSKKQLLIETDENNCKLGRWLGDAESMADIERRVPEMKTMLDGMKGDHARLHKSAVELKKLMSAHGSDRSAIADQLNAVYQTASVPALKGVRGSLHQMSELLASHVHEEEMRIDSLQKSTRRYVIVLLLVSLAVGAGVSFFISRSLSGQIREAVTFADRLAGGDFSGELAIIQKDEIGVLSKALNNIVSSLRAMVGEIKTSSSSLTSSSQTLSGVSNQLTAGADNTSMKSNTVASAAEEMSANMDSVAAATEQAATNVNMVSAAAEEMTSTINEISTNTAKTSSMAAEATTKADQASQRVDELGRSAQEISKVTETITEISEQTNLLALNATIEAARAGEAGKGFAVVANEIKELAKQTAEATLEIKNKIESVQLATGNTVKEINEVSVIINDVNEMSATVASAVEEQSATTREIAGNVAQASQGIQEVTENISQVATVTGDIATDIAGVDAAATELNESSAEVQTNANELAALAKGLETLVSGYTI